MAFKTFFPPIGGFGNPGTPWQPNESRGEVVLDGHVGRSLLLMVEPRDITEGLKFRAYGPIGYFERPSWLVRGNKLFIHPAATISRSSRPEDYPSNTWVPDVLQPTLNYGRSLFDTADPMNVTSPASGVIDLDDPDTRLEYLLNYSWDSVPITISRGHSTALFNTWAVVGRFSGANMIADMDKKSIRLRDIGWRLNTNIHSEYYDGKGGMGGDTHIAGKWRPYCVGHCHNIEPMQVNTNYQIFQFNIVRSKEVTELRHGGIVMSFHQDYPSYEALVAAADALGIPDGYYATCLEQSLVLCSFEITRSIRLDVIGDDTTKFGHGPPKTRAQIVRRLVTAYGDSSLDDENEIDILSFNFLDQQHPAELGYYWGSETKIDDAITQVMSGILGWWHVKPTGQLTLGYAREPRTFDSILDIEFKSYNMSKITMLDFVTPRTATHIGYKKNYGPEDRGSLAPGVIENEAYHLSQEVHFEFTSQAEIVDIYPTAETVKLSDTGYYYPEDALAESQRQQNLMGVERRRWQWTMDIDEFADILDKVFTIKNVNRLKLGDSTVLLCVKVDSVGFGPVTTEWWG